MIKISLSRTKKNLELLKADDVTIELILNNIRQYNDLIQSYEKNEKKNSYLMYQLNVTITKQIAELKKSDKKNNDESTNVNCVDEFLK